MNTIKLNTIGTPKAGGNAGGGGGGSASSMEYWDISNVSSIERDFILMSSYAVKGVAMGSKGVFTATQYAMVNGSPEDVEAVAIVLSLGLTNGEIHETIEQSLISAGMDTTSIPRLTEEEFYTL